MEPIIKWISWKMHGFVRRRQSVEHLDKSATVTYQGCQNVPNVILQISAWNITDLHKNITDLFLLYLVWFWGDLWIFRHFLQHFKEVPGRNLVNSSNSGGSRVTFLVRCAPKVRGNFWFYAKIMYKIDDFGHHFSKNTRKHHVSQKSYKNITNITDFRL